MYILDCFRHPPTIEHGTISRSYSSARYPIGREINVHCDDGYTATASTVTCRPTSWSKQWEPSDIACVRRKFSINCALFYFIFISIGTSVSCTVDKTPVNGFVSPKQGSRLDVGKRANYGCNRDYEISEGDKLRTCEKSGKLSGKLITCTLSAQVTCRVPMPPSGVTVTPPVGSTLKVGQRADFSCSGDQEISGTKSVKCLSNGQTERLSNPPSCPSKSNIDYLK